MSGMDRLTEADLRGLIYAGIAPEHVRIMACELLAHRRASQAAPAPSDGLREALEDVVSHVQAWRQGLEIAKQKCHMDDYGYWQHEINALDRVAAALTPSPAQEGGE